MQYTPIQAIAFLRSCVLSGETLSDEDQADIERTLSEMRTSAEAQEDASVQATFNRARMTMARAFRKDEGLAEAYRSNIAMRLHDRHGITDYEARNRAAADLMGLIFQE